MLAFDAPFFNTWRLWWTADGLGIILMTPIIVTWTTSLNILKSLSVSRLIETLCTFSFLVAFAWLLYGPFTVAEQPQLHNYMLFPLLIWIAFRFTQCGVSSALLLFAASAIWNTSLGYGRFGYAVMSMDERLMAVQLFLTIMSFTGLFLSTLVTERKQAGKTLQDSENTMRQILDVMPIGLWVFDKEGVIVKGNGAGQRIWAGAKYVGPKQYGEYKGWWMSTGKLVAAEEWSAFRAIQNGETSIEEELKIECFDGSYKIILNSAVPLFDNQHAVTGAIVVNQDITDRKRLEENQQTSVIEKETLLREVHHRVKNNLAVIIGLIDMQCQRMEDSQARAASIDLANRIYAMSLVHEKLYSSDSLARIDFHDYIETLISHLRSSFGTNHITYQVAAKKIEVPLDLAIPCGMIINELMTNSLKYAFPAGKPRPGNDTCLISVTMSHDNSTYSLCVADNGVGYPPGFDWTKSPTLGTTVIRMLGQHQLGGRYELDEMEGTRMTLTFTARKRKNTL